MADELQEVDVLEEEEDTARDLTSGLVITTTVVTLGAILLMLAAIGKYFDVGMFAG